MRVVLIEDKEFLMDQEDFESLPSNGYFKLDKDNYPLYYFYSVECRREKSFRVHRWVMGEPVGLLIDHINGNVLDARRSNLRTCTVSQNGGNRKKQMINWRGKATSSRYKGVIKSKNGKRWIAMLKSSYLGTFSTEEEAAFEYNKAASQMYGSFARLNVIPE